MSTYSGEADNLSDWRERDNNEFWEDTNVKPKWRSPKQLIDEWKKSFDLVSGYPPGDDDEANER